MSEVGKISIVSMPNPTRMYFSSRFGFMALASAAPFFDNEIVKSVYYEKQWNNGYMIVRICIFKFLIHLKVSTCQAKIYLKISQKKMVGA